MECDHYACYLEAKWVITPRDDKGRLVPERRRTFCSFCMMRVINRDGYHTAVIEKFEPEEWLVRG